MGRLSVLLVSMILCMTVNIFAGDVDLGGWKVVQEEAFHEYTIPDGIVVESNGYVIVARNCTLVEFETFWGITLPGNAVFIDSENSMPMINGDEYYTLKDSNETVIDGPTVAMSPGAGESVQRNNPGDYPGSESSWTRTADVDATPGWGAGALSYAGVVINEFSDASGIGNYIYEFVELFNDDFEPGGGTVIRVPSEEPTIQAGIDAAADSDTVLVAAGTYTGAGNRDICFFGKRIVVTSEDGAGSTVIDCEGAYRGFIFESGEDFYSELDGFTITNGEAVDGGAIYCESSSPTIRNNIVENSHASNYGGGIYLMNSSVRLTGNTISGNWNVDLGGGICCEGGYPIIQGNTIVDNSASDYGGGGGIAALESGATISDNVIIDNYASEGGGGIWLRGYSQVILEGNIIAGNESGEGGGIYCLSPLVCQNNMITGNDGWRAGGIYIVGALEVAFVNNTVCDNFADDGGGGIQCGNYSSPVVTNSIVWGNTAPANHQIHLSGGTVTVTYSDVEGGWTGDGNIDADPLFADPLNGDYHLALDSPCIDAGTPDGAPDHDIDHDPRPMGEGFDMGADEFEVEGPPGVTIAVEILTPVVEKPGRLEVRLTATNNEDQDVACEVFTRVKLPNGNWFPSGGWLFGPYSLTVPANQSRSGILAHGVPAGAPVGEYVYEANVGVLPDIWHTDIGFFTVE